MTAAVSVHIIVNITSNIAKQLDGNCHHEKSVFSEIHKPPTPAEDWNQRNEHGTVDKIVQKFLIL